MTDWTANKRALDNYYRQRKEDANTRTVRYHSSDDMAGIGELRELTEPVAVVLRTDGSVDVYGYVGVVDQRQAPTVYVLNYSHKHGDDITVYATEQLAYAALADIARKYWHEAVRDACPGDNFPQSADGLSDGRAVGLYFDALTGVESYEITAAPVLSE